MKSKKLKVAAILAFIVGIGVSLNASAMRADYDCMKRCQGWMGTSEGAENYCRAMCPINDPIG